MNLEELYKVCDAADMIVCGYAFTQTEDSNVRVLDINEPHHASLMTLNGDILETTMNDIELAIVKDYWEKNHKFMELSRA